MLNVSRTSVSEEWLVDAIRVGKPHRAHKSLDTHNTVEDKHYRDSSSSINSDLFPELLPWLALMNQPKSPCTQNIPSDISLSRRESGDIETVLDVAFSLSMVLDPSSLHFGFDCSCLAGLDDLLIYSPLDAFEECCWAEVAEDSPVSEPPQSPIIFDRVTPTSRPRRSESERPQWIAPLATSDSSDESDSDYDSFMTFKEDVAQAAIIGHSSMKEKFAVVLEDFEEELDTYDDEKKSFIHLPPHVVLRHQESVNYFPIPNVPPRRSMPSRLASFCANLRHH
ncbi:hypothetical protein D9619_002124 [Psilocybe cf. subviscida]|uniref:Uncharacterized protein n=1 Tax=Psilocybe cf. subviscida TaxID=2480587 RepID=A0A8H5BF84_9AGAR|nr:hypothetical protein D9619_002124 [Psilocybe cf. subviscida]